jgi:hypothetical protein
MSKSSKADHTENATTANTRVASILLLISVVTLTATCLGLYHLAQGRLGQPAAAQH